MSDSVQPQRRQPTRLPRPWDSPGKNTWVGCHFLLQCRKVKSESEVAQWYLTLATPWTAAHQTPWDFTGKSTGVGCHCLLLCMSTWNKIDMDTVWKQWILSSNSNEIITRPGRVCIWDLCLNKYWNHHGISLPQLSPNLQFMEYKQI